MGKYIEKDGYMARFSANFDKWVYSNHYNVERQSRVWTTWKAWWTNFKASNGENCSSGLHEKSISNYGTYFYKIWLNPIKNTQVRNWRAEKMLRTNKP